MEQQQVGALRVVGFDFAEPIVPAGRQSGGGAHRGLTCPVSPLGSLLQKGKPGSASSPNLYLVPSAPGSTTSCEDETVSFSDASAYCNQSAGYCDTRTLPARYPDPRSHEMEDGGDEDMDCCQTCSEPIPIPEPRPKTPEPAAKPKNLKRVPEPPMVRAVTAPAVVEELYAEYEKAKQQLVEQQLYQQMLATQGMPARKLADRWKSEAAAQASAAPEVEMKLSWRTVYTHMQTYGFTKRMTCN